MAKCEIVAGSVDQTIDVFIQDSSVTTGAGLSGLVFNTASLVCYYRKGATGTPTALSLVTQTVGGTHSDGGFVAVDGTNCPGQYRLDLSDTIVATPGRVTIYLRGAANMAPCLVEIEVVAVNKFDAVRGGLTALPNANAEAAGGLITLGTGSGQLTVASGAVTVGTNNDKTGYDLTQTFPTNFAALGINASGHISRATLVDTVTTLTGHTPQTGDNYARLGAPTLASVSADIAARASQTTANAIQVVTAALTSAAAAKLALSTGEMYAGTIDNTVTPTTTVFEADDITEATADHFKERTVIFTSGALKGQARAITAYSLVAGRGRFTVAALTEAPANNDQFLII